MPLEVEPPESPTIEAAGKPGDDFRRSDLQNYLEDGAWVAAFEAWAADTDVTEEEYVIATDLGLFEQFDFFWDEIAGRVGYSAPGIPEDWREEGYHPDIDSWRTVSSINAGLAEFGQRVCDVLLEEYIAWEDEEWRGDDELKDFE